MSTAVLPPTLSPMPTTSGHVVPDVQPERIVNPDIAPNPSPVLLLQMMLAASKTDATEFNAVLHAIYGEDLVRRVHASGLSKKWPQQLERRHILEMLAGIGHSITIKDLNSFWSLWRQMNAGSLAAQHLQIDPLTLKTFERIEDLPSGQLHKLIQAFRNPLALLEPANPHTLWEELGSSPKLSDKRCMAYTRYDHTVHQFFAKADRSRQELSFAPHELLAKWVAYAKPSSVQAGMVIPVHTNDKLVYYKLESQINKQGLHAYLFTPIDGKAGYPAQLVFRGTNGMRSFSRDLDTTGVGKSIFDKHAPDLLRMVEAYAHKVGNLNLEISGHSLGGADAQRAMGLLADQIASTPHSILNSSVKELRLFAYCSPKLDKATVEKWKQNLTLFAGLDNPPRIGLNFAEHENDPITKSGDFNLCSADASFIEANYLLVKSASGMMRGMMHHTTPFFRDGAFDFQTDGRTFMLYRDRIHKKVTDQLFQLAEKHLVAVPESDLASWELLLTGEEALSDKERLEKKEAEVHFEALQKEKAAIDRSQKGAAQHSWFAWTASALVGQPLKLVAGFLTSLL